MQIAENSLHNTLERCPEREVNFDEECRPPGTMPPAGQGESPPLKLVQSTQKKKKDAHYYQ